MDGLRLVLSLDYMDKDWESIKNGGFDGCLEVQRIVYILQLGGIRLGYHFSWYPPTSPYCEPLAAELEELSPQVTEHLRTLGSLRDAAMGKLDKVKSLLQPPAGLLRATWLELVASIHYLLHIAYIPPDDRGGMSHLPAESIDERKGYVLQLMTKVKPALKGHFEAAWDALSRVGLIEAKALPDGYSADRWVAACLDGDQVETA